MLTDEDIATLKHHEAEVRRLQDHGLPPFGAKDYLAAFMASRQKRAEMYAAEKTLRAEIDATLLPKLLAAYVDGTDAERAAVRDLLKACAKVAWGLGWAGERDAEAAISEDRLRRKLVLFAMKDGLGDYRDEIMTLDKYVADARGLGADVAALFSAAAAMASDASRGSRASVRETLLQRAASVG